MIKHIVHIILFILSFSITALAQDIPTHLKITHLKPKNAPDSIQHQNKIDENGNKWGIWQYYSNSGVLMLEVTYVNNRRTGTYKRYRGASGSILEEGNFENGLKNGKYVRYYSNGKMRVEGFYQNGRKIGTWTYFNKENGAIKIKGGYMNGFKEGVWRYFDKTETIRKTIEYKEGQITSIEH